MIHLNYDPEKARKVLLSLPATVEPLECEWPWVKNLNNGKHHLTVDGCQHAIWLRVQNREYTTDTPHVDEMCTICRRKWGGDSHTPYPKLA